MCVPLLFLIYVIFERPTNLHLKKIGPRKLIPAASISWGIVSMCTGFVQNKAQLIAMRLLLGACEAVYFPGICFYLRFWYRRRELGLRIFLLFTAAAVSGSCGGLLAYAIGLMDGVNGLAVVNDSRRDPDHPPRNQRLLHPRRRAGIRALSNGARERIDTDPARPGQDDASRRRRRPAAVEPSPRGVQELEGLDPQHGPDRRDRDAVRVLDIPANDH